MRKLPYKLQGNTPTERAHNAVVDYLQSLRPSPSPGVLTQHTADGVIRKAAQTRTPTGITLTPYLYISQSADYLACVDPGINGFDPTIPKPEGDLTGSLIYIAKPFTLRGPAAESVTDRVGGVANLAYADYDWSNQIRSVTDVSGTPAAIGYQFIDPPYIVNYATTWPSVIYAAKSVNTYALDPDENDIKLLDMNVDSRKWIYEYFTYPPNFHKPPVGY